MILLPFLCIFLLTLVIVYHERMEKRRLLKYAIRFVGAILIQKEGVSQVVSNDIVACEFQCKSRQILPIDQQTIQDLTGDLKFINLPGFIQYIDSVVKGKYRVRYFREAGYLFCFFPWQHDNADYKLLVFVRKSSGFESLIFTRRLRF